MLYSVTCVQDLNVATRPTSLLKLKTCAIGIAVVLMQLRDWSGGGGLIPLMGAFKQGQPKKETRPQCKQQTFNQGLKSADVGGPRT